VLHLTHKAVAALDGNLRDKVIEAELLYRKNPGPTTKAEYVRSLKTFKDFVLYGKTPEK
jgi:hypothetical protein